MEFTNLQKLKPGWYIARDNNCPWWNLYVHITVSPPYRCIKISSDDGEDAEVYPEEISQINSKMISYKEFEVIQELQKKDILKQ